MKPQQTLGRRVAPKGTLANHRIFSRNIGNIRDYLNWLDVCYLVNFENKMTVRSQHHMADPSVE